MSVVVRRSPARTWSPGVLVIRGLELVGVVLLAIYVPRLARALGADPGARDVAGGA